MLGVQTVQTDISTINKLKRLIIDNTIISMPECKTILNVSLVRISGLSLSLVLVHVVTSDLVCNPFTIPQMHAFWYNGTEGARVTTSEAVSSMLQTFALHGCTELDTAFLSSASLSVSSFCLSVPTKCTHARAGAMIVKDLKRRRLR